MSIIKDKVTILIMIQRHLSLNSQGINETHLITDYIQFPILTLELAKIEFELAAEYPALVKSSLLCKGTNSIK